MNRRVYLLAFLGLIMAMEVILGNLLSLQLLLTKISFSFLIVAVSARIVSPLMTALAYGFAYLIGMLLFPKFVFFPGFVVSAFLVGVIYGYFIYRKVTILRVMLANFMITFGVYLFLNSLWLHLMYGTSWAVLLSTRTIQEVVTFFVYTMVLLILFKLPVVEKIILNIRKKTVD